MTDNIKLPPKPTPMFHAYEYWDGWRTNPTWNGDRPKSSTGLHTDETLEAHAREAVRLNAAPVADELLRSAMERMDRARGLLTKGAPTPECNWGMLDTSDIRSALAAAPEPQCVPQSPHRPSPEWYRQKIQETDGMDEFLPMGGLFKPQGVPEPADKPLADWEDPDVQFVYRMMTDTEPPPNPDEHWEGYNARRVVAELRLRATQQSGAAADPLEALTREQERLGLYDWQQSGAAQPTAQEIETRLKPVFRDAMDWGRSYGSHLNLPDETREDVSEQFAEVARKALATIPPAQPEQERKPMTTEQVQQLRPFHIPWDYFVESLRLTEQAHGITRKESP